MIELQLPMVPSANRLWRRSGHVMHKSTEYKTWMMQAGLIARSQYKGPPILGPFKILLEISRPDRRRRDLDNRIKGALDVLQSVKFIRDDADCEEIFARWIGTGEGIFVRVQPA